MESQLAGEDQWWRGFSLEELAMALESLQDLFVNELKDIYNGESS
jgi:hypothetical protein